MKWSPQHYCKQGGRETRLLIPFPQETKGHACLTSAAQVANFRELVAGSQRGFGSEYLLDGRVCLRNGSIWLQRPELLQMRCQARVSFSFLHSDNNLSRMLGFLQKGICRLSLAWEVGTGFGVWLYSEVLTVEYPATLSCPANPSISCLTGRENHGP